jgi:hypothetical protein
MPDEPIRRQQKSLLDARSIGSGYRTSPGMTLDERLSIHWPDFEGQLIATGIE